MKNRKSMATALYFIEYQRKKRKYVICIKHDFSGDSSGLSNGACAWN